MKKQHSTIALILSLLILCTACQGKSAANTPADAEKSERSDSNIEVFHKKEEPLSICVDVAYLGIGNLDPSYNFESVVQGAVQGLVLEATERGGPQDIEIEVIPKEEAARKSTLTRIRTEIMSGEGPDIFIMGCSKNGGDALFPIPEKAMANGLFLPLDEYMENHTQFAEWDKFQTVVMAAGRNQLGQQIIPISYTLPITFFLGTEVTNKPNANTTWEDMMNDQSGVLFAAATWNHMNDSLIHMRDNYIEYTFGKLADYETEKLTFTEEDLLQRIIEIDNLDAEYESGTLGDIPAHYQTCLSVDYDNATGTNNSFMISTNPFEGISPSDTQTMVPIYCDDGGTSATLLSYAAVNVNTQRPEDAFFMLDVLMDCKTQQTSILYENWFTSVYGIPMHTDLLQPRYPTMYTSNSKLWNLTEENYAELRRVCDQISCARFRSNVDNELDSVYYAYVDAVRQGEKTNEELTAIVTEGYSKLQRLISE